ncbi:heavy metal translocating P-type ATPase [Chloroflexia bacterium SDU3-3]|nr:heavy metal translocating P-type ATPase [Chloroflexia bacterium SDU3-3]
MSHTHATPPPSTPASDTPGASVWRWLAVLGNYQTIGITIFATAAIVLFVLLRFAWGMPERIAQVPLFAAFAVGGLPLLVALARKLWRREIGSDVLAGIAILASLLLGEYLAGVIVIVMLAGGEALEQYALASASSVLAALAKRMPAVAHRSTSGTISDITLEQVAIQDTLVIYPHDICPADGVVLSGHGVMDESYLTGEPFQIAKTSGSSVLSGAINGEAALTIRVMKRPADSRYAKIMDVMRESEATRPQIRRLGDALGLIYTPVALAVAGLAGVLSSDAGRFLAVLVIATPCPLLIAIPVAIIGSISRCARRAIIVKRPAVLEQITTCRTAIFDKTGTLTYGVPALTDHLVEPGWTKEQVLALVAGLETYSKHPLARAIVSAAQEAQITIPNAEEVSEQPGQGLRGSVAGHQVLVTSRQRLIAQQIPGAAGIPPSGDGLECVVAIDQRYVSTLQFRDTPRADSRSFIRHLGPKHHMQRVMIVSGDREAEVRYLAAQVGISTIYAQQSPEEKLRIVREETAHAKTLYVGDGINDAPAMLAATVGIAIGQNSDVTAEAAGVVIMDNALEKVDEFFHIGRRMRTIALQSAIGGMALSMVGMLIAATGHLSPVGGAISQEVIDVLAVLNALRAAFPPRVISDMG